MRAYMLRRVVHMIPVLWGVATLVFFSLRLIPGDPAVVLAGEHASAAQINRMRQELGLNKPLPIQYVEFLDHMVTFQLGVSIRTGRNVSQELIENLAPTVELSVAALIIALIVGIPAGVFSAIRRNSVLEYLTMAGSMLGICMPVFWIGLMLIYWLGARAGWFPLSGTVSSGISIPPVTHFYTIDALLAGNLGAFKDVLWHLALPAVTVSTIPMAVAARMSRSSLLEVLGSEYLTTARAKGLTERLVIVRHALKNAMIPVITVVGLQVGSLLSGAVLTETVYGRIGIGRYIVQAIMSRDYPVVQDTVVMTAVFVVVINLLVDLAYASLDPRIRFE